MRELKFRAWDKLGKFYTGNGISFENHDNRLKLTPTASSRFTIEQYTGLKDKKGVEIYEGDIIEFELEYKSGRKVTGKIVYVEYDAQYYCETFEIYIPIYRIGVGFEVVGNIHENADLIK